jgi:hypothetical protein
VALWAVRQGVDPGDMHRMEQLALASGIELSPGHIALNGEDVTEAIRTPEVSGGASRIAVIPGVRRAMVAKHYYQVRRLNPPTKSKWESRLMTGIACCRLSAAIHTSLAGIGVPAPFSSSRMAA